MLLTSFTGSPIELAGLTVPEAEDSVSLSAEAYLSDENRRAEINRLWAAGSLGVTEEDSDFHLLPNGLFPAYTAGELETQAEGAERFEVKINVPGTLTVAAGGEHVPLVQPGKLVEVVAVLGTNVAGADLILDVNKNSTTVFTTQTDRLHITDGGTGGVGVAADWTVGEAATKFFAAGDVVSVDVDQIGTTGGHHGADLDVVFVFEKQAASVLTDY